MEYDEEVSILPAFRKLVNLYWIFDRSEAFDLIQSSKSGLSTPQAGNMADLSVLQSRLQAVTIDLDATNNVQAADICITRAWMCTLLWRIATSRGLAPAPTSNDPSTSPSYPIQIAKEFLSEISRLPTAAIESLGPIMVSISIPLLLLDFLKFCRSSKYMESLVRSSIRYLALNLTEGKLHPLKGIPAMSWVSSRVFFLPIVATTTR